MRPKRFLPLTVVLASLAWPAGAMASDFQKIFGDYKSDGQINGCYRPDQLHNAGRDIPPDIEQYAPGFGDALSSAGVNCSSPAPSQPEEPEKPVISAGGPGGPDIDKKKSVREPPAPAVPAVSMEIASPNLTPAAASVSRDTPGALIALLVAAGIAVVLALAWTLAWFMGWSPERLTKPLSAAFNTLWDRLSIRSSS